MVVGIGVVGATDAEQLDELRDDRLVQGVTDETYPFAQKVVHAPFARL